MINKKKDVLYLIITIVTLIALVMGATYAYLQAQTKNGTNTNVDITSGTTDHLVFATDGNITINASADNFKENGLDLSKTATASAILTANNTNHIANDTYNVYLDITNNNLEYSSYKKDSDTKVYLTQEEKEQDITNDTLDGYNPIPELYLKVEGPTTFSKTINGLTLDNEGYDITEKRGLITIAEDIPITTKAPEGITTDTWTITITFKNLKTNQQLNTGKELKGKIIIQKEKLALSKLLADANKEGGEPTLIYHDGQKDYVKETNYALEAEDYSYRYSGGNDVVNNYVCFGGECSDNPEDPNYLNLYRIIGLFKNKENNYEMKLIKADYATEEELGGEDVGSFLLPNYSESSPYNFWQTYIGKLTSVPSYCWNNASGGNDWSQSNLNQINLNEHYLNTYLKEKDNGKWNKMITNHTWITGGNTLENISNSNAKIAYENEIKKPNVGQYLPTAALSYPAYIGLMYASDYGYATKSNYWSNLLENYTGNIKDNDWMYLGLFEYTITRVSTDDKAFLVYTNGHISVNSDVNKASTDHLAIRPVIYLNTTVKIIDGNGTSSNPYIISQE